MNKKFSEHIVGQFSKEYLCRVPHHVAPSLNLHKLPPSNAVDVSDLLLKELPYSVTLPTPITPFTETSSQAVNGIDPVTNLLRQKIKWEIRREKLLKCIRADKGTKISRTEKRVLRARVGERVPLPRGVAMLARHLDSDPDPAFSGVYNWYYTGGTMAILETNQGCSILCASSVNGEIRICKAQANNFETTKISIDCVQPIHQIFTNSKGIAVRQRNRLHILTPVNQGKEKLELNIVQSVHNEKDNFVSAALQSESLQQFCTLSTKGSLRLWDSETLKKRLSVGRAKRANLSDCWGSLLYQDPNTILHTDRCCIHAYDIRVGIRRQASWCPINMLEQCQQLSLLVPSQKSSAFYAATSHQLLLLDSRFGFGQCWTHLMAAPPYVGSAQFIEDNAEVVCLGSQVMTECVAVVNRWRENGSRGGDEAWSSCLPKILPCPAESLLRARQRGLGLNPSFTTRCSMSTTGLAVVPSKHGLRVLRQSATGDLFAQFITRTANQDSAIEEDWACANFAPKPQTAPLNVTETEDCRPLLAVLTGAEPLPLRPAQGARTGTAWRVSKKYLEDCIDLMADKILRVWEIEGEDEWLDDVEEMGEEDPEERVLNWLGAADQPADNTAEADAAENIPEFKVDHEDDLPYESAEIYPSTSSHYLDQIKTEPEFYTSAWEFPQVRQQTKRTHLSPNPSEDEFLQIEKRQKTFDESFMPFTPAKPPASIKKSMSSVKKKFVPGF